VLQLVKINSDQGLAIFVVRARQAAIVSVRIGIGAVSVRAAVGVRTVDAVVDIIVGIGPSSRCQHLRNGILPVPAKIA
jgi:hypothetical protein